MLNEEIMNRLRMEKSLGATITMHPGRSALSLMF